MKRLIGIVIFAVSACSACGDPSVMPDKPDWAPQPAAKTCQTVCGPVTGPANTDCANVDLDVRETIGLVDTYRVASREELCAALTRVAISIRAQGDDGHGEYVPSVYGPDGGILPPTMSVDWAMSGFAHEALHALDDERGTLDTANPHAGWGVPGTPKAAYQTVIQTYNTWSCSSTGTGPGSFICDHSADGGSP